MTQLTCPGVSSADLSWRPCSLAKQTLAFVGLRELGLDNFEMRRCPATMYLDGWSGKPELDVRRRLGSSYVSKFLAIITSIFRRARSLACTAYSTTFF